MYIICYIKNAFHSSGSPQHALACVCLVYLRNSMGQCYRVIQAGNL